MLVYGIKSHYPLNKILGKHNDRFQDILIMYGDNDWMDCEDALKHISTNKWNIDVILIPQAGHVLMFDNPCAVSSQMIDFLLREPRN